VANGVDGDIDFGNLKRSVAVRGAENVCGKMPSRISAGTNKKAVAKGNEKLNWYQQFCYRRCL
jgi:hypothetical protein